MGGRGSCGGALRAPGSRVHVGEGVAGALVRTPHDAGSELIPTLVRRALATVQRTGSTKTHTQAREEQPGVRSYGRGNAGRVQVCRCARGLRGVAGCVLSSLACDPRGRDR